MTSADVALLEYDVAEDEILKDDTGFCKKINNHDPGLLIVEIGPNAVLMDIQIKLQVKRNFKKCF